MDRVHSTDIRGLLRRGLSKSLASLLIKVMTAGLTYLMLVVLSRSMGGLEYGYFAFGLSLATVLAIGANYGQQMAVLRFWPEEIAARRPSRAREALRAGGAVTVMGGLCLSAALLLVALGASIAALTPHDHLYAAALLVLPLALAEYWSSALRAQGSVWTALAPRDILWRLVVPIVVVAFAMADVRLSGWATLTLAAFVLALALVAQYALAGARAYEIALGTGGLGAYWRARGKASGFFLLATLFDSVALNLDTILVGLLVAPESAGIYYNAVRTAGLLTLFHFALTIVVAPMIARHYHSGEMRKAQAITALSAWAGFAFAVVVLVGFWWFGRPILGLFGDGQEFGWIILMIIGLGLVVEAATGPTSTVFMMTGHERDYVRIFGIVIGASLILQLAVIPIFGPLGAAIVTTVARIAAQAFIALYAHRKIGIETTLIGAFLVNRLTDRRLDPAPQPGL